MISVAICTRNRCNSLGRALNSLTRCLPEPNLAEVLVIDNGSEDRTAEIANSYLGILPIRCVKESSLGLSNARNRALREFKSDWLLFTDDDVVVDPAWIAGMHRGLAAFPESGFVGGRIIAKFEGSAPGWLRDPNMPLISGVLVQYDLGIEDRRIKKAESLPFGANFAISRMLYADIGFFNTELGVKGKIPGRGEETEYLLRALNQGWHGCYLANSLVYHLITKKRISLAHFYRHGIQKGIAAGHADSGINSDSIFKEYEIGLRGLLQLLRGRGDRFRQCIINMGMQRGRRKSRAQRGSAKADEK